jgi:hypothetical protein
MGILESDGLPGLRAQERHVFVSHDGRRQRVLRIVGMVAGVLALAWLAALGLALGGGTSLPLLRAPGAKQDAPKHAASAQPRHSHAIRQATAHPHARPLRPEPATLHDSAAPPAAPAPALGTTRPAPAVPVTPAVPVQPTPVTTQRGWARRGWTAPPGQAIRSAPTPRGRGHSKNPTTTTTHGNGHGRG